VSSAASTAADKARDMTGRTATAPEITLPSPATSEQIEAASYDAEDRRPATSTSATMALETPASTMPASDSAAADTAPRKPVSPATTQPLQTLSSIETFESTMADVTASTTIEPSDLALDEAKPSTADVYDSQFGGMTGSTTGRTAVSSAQAELSSPEQFEVTDTLNTDTTDDTESRGTERGA